jgi:hypothetical protein
MNRGGGVGTTSANLRRRGMGLMARSVMTTSKNVSMAVAMNSVTLFSICFKPFSGASWPSL